MTVEASAFIVPVVENDRFVEVLKVALAQGDCSEALCMSRVHPPVNQKTVYRLARDFGLDSRIETPAAVLCLYEDIEIQGLAFILG
jgi:hypothetical protein